MELTRITSQDSRNVLETKDETKETELESPNSKEMDAMKNNNVSSRDNYTAVSKDGDTLEIDKSINFRTKNTDSGVKEVSKISDATLAKYSSTKLKQLLQQGKISKLQYNKAMKKNTK